MKNRKKKQNLLCKKAVYISTTGGASSRMVTNSKENAMLLCDLVSVIPNLPKKRSAATVL